MTQRIDQTNPQPLVGLDTSAAPAETDSANTEISLPDIGQEDAGIAAQAELFEKKLDRLLNRAASSGTAGLSASYHESIESAIPRPSFGKSGYLLHPKILDAAKQCDLAAKNLAELSLKDCQTAELGDKQFDIIREYVTAQHTLYGAIQAYLGKTGKASPLLESLMQATQFRAGEALNLVGTMQQLARNNVLPNAGIEQTAAALSGIDTEKSLLQGMQAISPKMHGHVLADKLQTAAAALFAETEKLEQTQAMLSPTDFSQKAAELKNEVQNLKTQIAAIDNPQNGLQMDSSLHAALFSCVSRMEARLDGMEHINPYETVSTDAQVLLNTYDTDMFSQIKTKNPLIGGFLKELQTAFAAHNQQAEQFKQDILDKKLTPREVHDKLFQIMNGLWKSEPRKAVIAVFYMSRIQKSAERYGPDLKQHLGEIKQDLIQNLNKFKIRVSDKEAKELIDFSLENMENKSFSALCEHCTELALMSTELFTAEARELSAMYEKAENSRAKLQSDHILEALEHNVDMSTLLEASMRGIPLDQLETMAGDAVLVQSKVLGQGAANTVNLCTYHGKDGEEMQLVFKPELHARYGLGHLTASGLGYKSETKVMQINIAACRCAQSIGCGDVIAKSSIGSFNGKFGLFMEAAKGATFYGIKYSKKAKCGTNSKGETFSFGQSIQLLTQKGLRDTLRANLLRELCKLEWADCLSGQADRHGDNYLVSIDTDTGKVTVTGIDNDASFGIRKVGMTKIRIGTDQKKIDKLSSLGPVSVSADGIIDTASFNDEQLKALQSLYGFNQLFAPSHIDKETYEKLMAIDVEEYKRSLAECLDSDAVESAVLRLQDAQNHAQELKNQGKVVENWESTEIYKDYLEESKRSQSISMGFFARDFLHLPPKK